MRADLARQLRFRQTFPFLAASSSFTLPFHTAKELSHRLLDQLVSLLRRSTRPLASFEAGPTWLTCCVTDPFAATSPAAFQTATPIMKRLFHRKDKTSNQPQATYNDLQPYHQPGAPTASTAAPPHGNSLAPPVPHANPPQGSTATIPRPPRVSDVGNAIGWTCGVGFDFAYILSLADHLVASKDASKEAAKALSKEFKVRHRFSHAMRGEGRKLWLVSCLPFSIVQGKRLTPAPHRLAARGASSPRARRSPNRHPLPQYRHSLPE